MERTYVNVSAWSQYLLFTSRIYPIFLFHCKSDFMAKKGPHAIFILSERRDSLFTLFFFVENILPDLFWVCTSRSLRSFVRKWRPLLLNNVNVDNRKCFSVISSESHSWEHWKFPNRRRTCCRFALALVKKFSDCIISQRENWLWFDKNACLKRLSWCTITARRREQFGLLVRNTKVSSFSPTLELGFNLSCSIHLSIADNRFFAKAGSMYLIFDRISVSNWRWSFFTLLPRFAKCSFLRRRDWRADSRFRARRLCRFSAKIAGSTFSGSSGLVMSLMALTKYLEGWATFGWIWYKTLPSTPGIAVTGIVALFVPTWNCCAGCWRSICIGGCCPWRGCCWGWRRCCVFCSCCCPCIWSGRWWLSWGMTPLGVLDGLGNAIFDNGILECCCWMLCWFTSAVAFICWIHWLCCCVFIDEDWYHWDGVDEWWWCCCIGWVCTFFGNEPITGTLGGGGSIIVSWPLGEPIIASGVNGEVWLYCMPGDGKSRDCNFCCM